jgi:hypothetical protein
MAEIRHMISVDAIEKLNALKPVLGDPMQMHKTKFVKYLEYQADVIYQALTDAGCSGDEAFAKTQEKLADLTREWKAAARAKFGR